MERSGELQVHCRLLKRSELVVFALLSLLFLIFPVFAMAASPRTLIIPMLAHEPSMNGRVGSTWANAIRVIVGYDFTDHRAAVQPTIVHVAQDATGLDIAFDVAERQGVEASTVTNGSAVLDDDSVGIYISPQGTHGFSYNFYANARGARGQTSSENTSYAPTWTAVGRITRRGYVVTMHIPFAIIRNGDSKQWRVQLWRFRVGSNRVDTWTHDVSATSLSDPAFFGTFADVETNKRGMSPIPKWPTARVQPYLLEVARSTDAAGGVSQMGLDMAVPITGTSSFVGSFHPDYSNVETDQQTISPTAFPRQYAEVRPFFAQVGTAFNNMFECTETCPQTLYTPAIPTFNQAYGLEGTQGLITFSGFDAVGAQRTDVAEAADYFVSNTERSLGVNAQRISVNTPEVTDSTTSVNGGYTDQRWHLSIYGNYAHEAGTFVSEPSLAGYGEIGAGYKTANTSFFIARQFIGAQFSPVDGYVQQSDIGGYTMLGQQIFLFSPRSSLREIEVYFDDNRFWNHLHEAAQNNAGYQININLKDQLSFHVFQRSSFVLTSAGKFLPFTVGNGAFVGYNLDSNYPVGLLYGTGAYYHGHASTWQFFDTVPVRRQISLSLAINENTYTSHRSTDPSFSQWLNSASVNWQFSRDASFSFGARRINGVNLPNAFTPPDFTSIFADNLSAAFHYLHGHNEFYLVYGDPNALVTTPAIYFKWIVYAGAEKGT